MSVMLAEPISAEESRSAAETVMVWGPGDRVLVLNEML